MIIFIIDLIFSGKSLICKERAIQTQEKEKNDVERGLKTKADPVFFISMVGVDENGMVDENQRIFDVYTKLYDFVGVDVQVLSAQDLLKFYASRNKKFERNKIDIYTLVEYFILMHPNGHYVLDECPILNRK